MIRVLVPALCACLLAVAAGATDGCGVDAPCRIDGGSYHVALPDNWDGTTRAPVIVFFHGHRSSGKSVIAGGVRDVFGEAGYVVVAPNGAMRPGSGIRAWPARPGSGDARDDVAFTFAVLDDLQARVAIDRSRVLMAGFSAGGSMAWMVGCYAGGRIAGVVSVAGALRRPIPETECPGGPFRLLHIHGFNDRQVPLEGRAIRDWHQGDVFEALSLLRRTNSCRSRPSSISRPDRFRCRHWDACGTQADIRLCLHDGAHGLPRGWAAYALDWFETGQAE